MNPGRRALLATAPSAALIGCAQLTAGVSAASTAASGATADIALADATEFWGVIKGMALVAEAAAGIADPPLAVAISAGIAGIDSLIAAPPTASLASQIVSQAVKLTNQVAPKIQVIPS